MKRGTISINAIVIAALLLATTVFIIYGSVRLITQSGRAAERQRRKRRHHPEHPGRHTRKGCRITD